MQVNAGYRIIGECSWHHCQHLQIVHLASTVTSLQTRAFCRCYALRRVLAPGCKEFGTQVFAECCSLLQVGIRNDTTNQLAPQAELRPRAFHKCTALRQLDLELSEYNSNSVMRVLPECCFLEAGLTSLTLPSDLTWIGPAACERCLQLQLVDLSQTRDHRNYELCLCTLSALANPKASKQTAKDPAGSLPQVCPLDGSQRATHPALYCEAGLCRMHAAQSIPKNWQTNDLARHILSCQCLSEVR